MYDETTCCRHLFIRSDGNGANNDAIFQHHAQHQENKVKQEHGGPQCLVHLPLAGCNGDGDKEEHYEEQHDGTEESVAADSHWSQTVAERVQEPRDWEPFETTLQRLDNPNPGLGVQINVAAVFI